MRPFFRVVLGWLALAFTLDSQAQLTIPTLSQRVPSQTLGVAPTTLDLRNYFGVPGVAGQVVQITTTSGRINVELQAAEGPTRNVENFLNYVRNRAYDNTVVHAVSSLGTGFPAVVRGGGYSSASIPPSSIARNAPVPLEYKLPNVRGTLAMARGADGTGATSEWFINTQDNTAAFGPTNAGGFTVIGRVLGTGMTIVDSLGQIPVFNLPGTVFTEIPLRNTQPNQTQLTTANLVAVTSVRVVPIYASTFGETSLISFNAASSNDSIVSVSVSGATLTLRPLAIGTVNVTVRGADANGNFADALFSVTVPTAPVVTPLFTAQPVSQSIVSGSTVVFEVNARGAPTYQWFRNGAAVGGATNALLVLPAASAAQIGTYTCVATNSAGSTVSAPATLELTTAGVGDPGRLSNLSVLAKVDSGVAPMTVGAVVGPGGTTGDLLLLVRAVGPTLESAFGATGALPDPEFKVRRTGLVTPIASNDNWGGSASLTAVFSAVGAFRLAATSLDSANLVGAAPAAYTVEVVGKDSSSGLVLTEIYDGSGLTRTAATPRLINLSTLTEIEEGGFLAAGFVIGGATSRTVLMRGVGPSLEVFGVRNVMVDPKLEVFENSTGRKIGENDDWGGLASLAALANSVGAFPLAGPTTADAIVVITLPPGSYTARVTGAFLAPGNAIIEIYEVP